jgi:hypothetical protein
MDVSAWQKAVQRSRAILTKEEQVRYAGSQPHDIVLDFENFRKKKAQTNKVEFALSKIQPLVVAIERYGKSLDVIANLAPDILSPVWGTIRALLMVCMLLKKQTVFLSRSRLQKMRKGISRN